MAMSQQSIGFLKGAVLTCSVMLGGGYVAIRAGWIAIPSASDDPNPTFSSSKSTFIFVGDKVRPSETPPTIPLAQPEPATADLPTLTVVPNTPTPLPPNITIMAGSKSIAPLLPPKTQPQQQATTPPKK